MNCPYCGELVVLIDSTEVYHGRSYGNIYICRPCQAWVGVHKGTNKPLGRLANKELRDWKMRAHAAFDPLWVNGQIGRSDAYDWLARELGIDRKDCHIGMFDVAECKRVVEICSEVTA